MLLIGLPGAAAPPADELKLLTSQSLNQVSCSHWTWGQLDHEEVHLTLSSFCRQFLKPLIVWALTSSWDNLFRRLIERWKKECCRMSPWLYSLYNFQLWPLVTLSALRKNWVQEIAENTLTILKISSRSALFRLSSRVHNPSLRNHWPFVNLFKCNFFWLTLTFTCSCAAAFSQISTDSAARSVCDRWASLWSPYLIGQTIIFSSSFFLSFFLSFFFVFFSSPNLSGRRLDV